MGQALHGWRQILTGLAYLHNLDQRIAHCDLKPENILIQSRDSDGLLVCKIGDLGLATTQPLQRDYVHAGCSWPFVAPEGDSFLGCPSEKATKWPEVGSDFCWGIAGDIYNVGLLGSWLFDDHEVCTHSVSSRFPEAQFNIAQERSSGYTGVLAPLADTGLFALFPTDRRSVREVIERFDRVFPREFVNLDGQCVANRRPDKPLGKMSWSLSSTIHGERVPELQLGRLGQGSPSLE